MPLNFPNVAVLGLSQDTRFFDAGFQYSSYRRLSIGGTVNDLTNQFGISGVWNGPEGVLATIRNNRDYQALTLNGVDFGSGRIENISFDAGQDVRLKTYTANILIFDSGNLFNLTGTYYSGVSTSNWQYLQTFSEDYSFDRKLNGGYAYTHSAAIQFTSGVGQLNAIAAAQSLARTLFTGGNLGLAFYPQYTNKQGKRYITETYNVIDNSCGFQETFDFDNDNGAYSATYTTSVQLDERGVLTATENGNIRGIENPNYQKALSAVGIEMTGAYLRCSGAATNYFPTGAILVTSPVSQGRAIDIFNNNVDYSITFDNSPTNQRTYFWDYLLQASKQDGVSTVTEQGSVVGRGENTTTAFDNARAGFNIVKAGIAGRTTAMFVFPYTPVTNYLEQKQESYSPIQSQVGYSYQYSNDPTLVASAGIRRQRITEEQNDPVYSYNKVGIINSSEIAQNDYQSTVGSNSITIDMEGDKTVSLAAFRSAAITAINARAPAGNDRYVGGVSYSYAPNENAANFQLTWLFNRAANQTIFP